MKKFIFVLGLLFTLNAHSQDTNYFVKRQSLYRSVTVKMTDSASKYKVTEFELKRRRRIDRTWAIIGATIFSSLTVWYFEIIK